MTTPCISKNGFTSSGVSRALVLSSIALPLMAAATETASAATNLLVNGDFEDTADVATSGWGVTGTSALSAILGFTQSGARSLNVLVGPDAATVTSTAVTTVAGSTYSVFGYVRSGGPTSVNYQISFGGTTVTSGITTGEWVLVGGNVTAQSTSSAIVISLPMTGFGIFLDNFSVYLAPPTTITTPSSTSSGVVDRRQPFFTFGSPEGSGSVITFDGGTLKVMGTTSTGQSMTIQVNGGIIDSNGNLVYLTGTVSGTGALMVSGTNGGEVHANSVVAVPVTVDGTGTLRGTGTISGATTVAGTLAPGNSPGTLTFLAPVTMGSGSTLALDIDGTGAGNGAGNYSRAVVIGGGFTAAGTLAPRLRGITYASGEVQGTNSYTPALGQKFAGVVQATGGVTGSFSSLTQPDGLGAGTRFDTVYNRSSIDLYVTPASYGNLAAAGVGQTANQSSVGSALDRFRPLAGVRTTGDTKTIFDALAPLDGAALPRALTQVAGEGNANLPVTAVDVGRSFGNATVARLGSFHGGQASLAAEAARGLTTLSFGSTGGINGGATGVAASSGARKGAATRSDRAASGLAAGDGAGTTDTLSVWARGFGTFTSNSGDDNNPGFNRTIAGGLAGGDLPILDDVRAGVAVGYARSDVTGSQSSGTATADSYHAGLYAGWTPGPWFVDGTVGVTYNSFETRRDLAFGSYTGTARGKTRGFDVGTGLEAGRRFELAGFALEPSLDLRYDYLTTDAYTESGADGFALSVKGETRHALRAGLGGTVSRTFQVDDGLKVQPELRARWEHDVLDGSGRVSQSLNGSAFTVAAAKPGRDAALLGAGVAAVVDGNLKLYVQYDSELRANQTDHTVTGGLRYSW